MESLHLTYLKNNQKTSYSQFNQHLYTKLQAAAFPDEDIDSLLNLKEKLSYFIYNTRIHLVNPDNVIDEIAEHLNEKSHWSEVLSQNQFLLHNLQDKRKCNSLAWIICEERKKYACLHDMEGGSVTDMQDIMNSMDYIEFVRLAKYRKSCVIQQDVEFSHELSSVQEKFEMCYDALRTQLDSLRHHIYRVDRDSNGMLRVMRSLNDITERNVESEVDKCKLRCDYLLFALRQWRAMSMEIKHVFNNNSSIMAKMDKQIETAVLYIENILKMSFVMIRQPDSINVMQTPSTQRILREREFIKGSFLGYSSTHVPWINITSPCLMYLVGLNEYKSSDSVYEQFSPKRKTAYDGDLYEPSSKSSRNGINNPQKFAGSDVCFPRVHMINLNLKRRCREVNSATNKRKHDDLVNCNAAPEEIFSFVLSFDISYDIRAHWNSFTEDAATARRTLNIQTCSKPVAILVHASQKPLAEGKLFWCRFNPKWHMPLHEVSSVTGDVFKKTLFEYTYDNFARELSSRELDYLMSQIAIDQRQGYKVIAKSVLKDEAQYTEAPDNPPKRKSFWCWFYDLLVFLCKGKGKSNSKCNMDNPLKKHWMDGRICLLSRAQAQEDILAKQGSHTAGLGAVIRVSESKPRTLNVLSINDSWGVGEKEIDGLDQHLRNKFALIWSECKQTWVRTDLVCETRVLDNIKYKPLLCPTDGPMTPTMEPSSPSCMTPQPSSMTPVSCMSPVVASPMSMSYQGSYAGSPLMAVQGGESPNNWNARSVGNHTPSHEPYINPPTFTETYSVNDPNCYARSPANPYNLVHQSSLGNMNGRHSSPSPMAIPIIRDTHDLNNNIPNNILSPTNMPGNIPNTLPTNIQHKLVNIPSSLPSTQSSGGLMHGNVTQHGSPSGRFHMMSIDERLQPNGDSSSSVPYPYN